MVKQLQYIYSSVAILLILCLFSLILFVSKKCYFCCQGDGFVPCLANKVMCKWLSALQSRWCWCLVGDLGDLGVVVFSVCFDAVLTVRLGLLEVFFSLQCILILRSQLIFSFLCCAWFRVFSRI